MFSCEVMWSMRGGDRVDREWMEREERQHRREKVRFFVVLAVVVVDNCRFLM